MEPALLQRLTLKYDEPPSDFAFNFKLRPYIVAVMSPQSAYTPLRFKYAFDEKRVFLVLAGYMMQAVVAPVGTAWEPIIITLQVGCSLAGST